MENWQGEVYKKIPKIDRDFLRSDNQKKWNVLRETVFIRDYYTCQRCNIFADKNSGTALSCHHIKPRSEGGEDEIDNLITYCHRCHDYVEEHPDETEIVILNKKLRLRQNPNEPRGYNWQKWVYGMHAQPY